MRTLLRTALALALALPFAPHVHAQTIRLTRAPRAVPAGEFGATLKPCGPRPLTTPTFAFDELLHPWQMCSSAAWPFSAAYAPDGGDLFVPLFGGFIGSGGCVVARLDPATLQLRGTISTGESPEEVAFVTRPDGSLLHGFVTDSSASQVTVFDDLDRTVATIGLPPDPNGPYPTAFPFGLAVAPDQRTVHVGTNDGQGIVHAIDVATLQLDPTRTIHLGADRGTARMAFSGDDLVICVTRFFPGLSGSVGEVFVVDPRMPQLQRSVALASAMGSGLFPNPQDIAIGCDGVAWVAGLDMGARVFGIDPAGPTIVADLPTHTSVPAGKFQALGLSPDGLLVVADYFSDEVAMIDVRTRTWRGLIDLSQAPTILRAPQDVAFSPDGRSMVIPYASSGNLALFDL